jgi:hypothetical protein
VGWVGYGDYLILILILILILVMVMDSDGGMIVIPLLYCMNEWVGWGGVDGVGSESRSHLSTG